MTIRRRIKLHDGIVPHSIEVEFDGVDDSMSVSDPIPTMSWVDVPPDLRVEMLAYLEKRYGIKVER